MKQNSSVQVYTLDDSTGYYDSNGVWIQGRKPVTFTMCFIEPYSQEKAKYKYGIDVETNRRVFIDHIDTLIKIGMVMTIDNKDYEIKAIPWDLRHMEILVLGKDSVSQ